MNSDEYKKAVGMDMIDQRRREEAKRPPKRVAKPADPVPEVKPEPQADFNFQEWEGI